jgi:glucan phosphoethanolaminetransferase (alkaline phosphatase superfamily)
VSRIAPALLVAAAYLVLDDFALIRMGHYQASRGDVGDPLFNVGAFAAVYLLGLSAVALLHVHERPSLRLPTHLLAVVSITVYFAFAALNGRGFTTTEANLLWSEVEYVPSALRFFLGDYAGILLSALASIGLLELWLWRRPTGIRSLWVVALAALASLLSVELLARTDSQVEQFPLTVRVPALTAYAFFHQSIYTGEREPPPFGPEGEALASHVIVVVDESIRGDLLSLNGGALPTTPFLEAAEGRLLNYGVVSAVANLSAPSNLILQSGLRPDQLPDGELRSLKNPNVFMYFAAAGYRVTLVNAQNVLARPPNFMSEADIAQLDAYVQVREGLEGVTEDQVDHALPGILAAIVAKHPRTFTYVIKNGAHFPYRGRFPDSEKWIDADVWRDDHGERRAEVLANYYNTLRWTVDDFMRVLVAGLEGKAEGTLIVYTADHGQSLYEPRSDGRAPIRGHGHADPPREQAEVPLFLWPLDEGLRSRLAPLYRPELRDRGSAFAIFPTLLRLAGYTERQLEGRYVPSLFAPDAAADERVFVSGNHFGRDGPLYRDAPYQSSFQLNSFDRAP